jgi:hypothetical protein
MSYLYYTAVGRCIADDRYENGSFQSHISPAKAATGQWFYDVYGSHNKTTTSFLITNDTGKLACGSAELVNGALAAWGKVSSTTIDPIQALCTLGFTRDNRSDCVTGTDNFSPPDNSVNTYKNNATRLDSLTPATRYILSAQSFR